MRVYLLMGESENHFPNFQTHLALPNLPRSHFLNLAVCCSKLQIPIPVYFDLYTSHKPSHYHCE